MAMLYGMDQAGTGASQSQIDELHQEYLNIMSQYKISDETTMETYWKSQLNAATGDKLPGNC